MLTLQQKQKLRAMTMRYYEGVKKNTTSPEHIVRGWALRYKASMWVVIENRCKR